MLGNIIKGKWNKEEYLVIKKIGQGGIGTVYKVKDSRGNIRALKISRDVMSITREYAFMKKLENQRWLPNVYEIDDYEDEMEFYSFLVMDYIEGENLKDIINKNNLTLKEILGIGMIIFSVLEEAYKKGFLYGDIKMENIVFDRTRRRIVFIDFGGVIEKDNCIIEYTPTYNMKSWGIGINKDWNMEIIFGTTMIIVSMIFKKEFNPLRNCIDDVINQIKLLKINQNITKFLIKGLKIEFNNTSMFKRELERLVFQTNTVSIVKRKVDYVDIILITSIGVSLITLLLLLNYC